VLRDIGEDHAARAERRVAGAVGHVPHEGEVLIGPVAEREPGGEDAVVVLEGHRVRRIFVGAARDVGMGESVIAEGSRRANRRRGSGDREVLVGAYRTCNPQR